MSARARLPLLALAALLAFTPVAHAQTGGAAKGRPLDEAREHARQGALLYRDGDFAAALVEFKRAYALLPNYRVLYNVAQTHAELQDYAAAIRAFERYLAEGGAKVPRDRRAAVEGELAKLAPRVGTVRVSVNVEDAEVLVDGASVGRSPIAEPLVLNVGTHTFSASKPPLTGPSRSIELAGRDQATVLIELAEPPPPSPLASPSPSSPPRAPPPAAPAPGTPWVGIALTGAFALGATATGLLTLDARHDFKRELDRFPSSESDINGARTRMHVFAISTDVLAVAALASAAISAYPFVFNRSSGHNAAWGVRVGPTSLVLDARF